jgi:hypothetical protein
MSAFSNTGAAAAKARAIMSPPMSDLKEVCACLCACVCVQSSGVLGASVSWCVCVVYGCVRLRLGMGGLDRLFRRHRAY